MRVRLYDSARKVMARIATEMLDEIDGAGPVLDLGCGPGLIANWLGQRQQRAIYGIDIGASSVAAAQASATGRNRFAAHDGKNIPYRDDEFDAVLCLEVIEHVEEDRALIAEVARVLRPGGRLLLSTTNAERASLADKPHHVRHYTAPELLQFIRGAGLEIIDLTHRYHPIGHFIDRNLIRLGGSVAVDELDDEALTVSSHQRPLTRALLGIYDRAVDPLVTELVWAEYRARRSVPGGSLVALAMAPRTDLLP